MPLKSTYGSWGAAMSRPPGDRALLELSIHIHIHLLVEERQVALDLRALGDGVLVAPDDVWHLCVAHLRGPVRGVALVGAGRGRRRWDQEVHADVARRQVVARRMARLEEEDRLARLGDR